MRKCAMTPLAMKLGPEAICCRENRPRLGCDQAHLHPRPTMQPKDRIHLWPDAPIQNASCDHAPGSSASLLGRLPEQLDAYRKFPLHRLEDRRDANQSGRVAIMPASVHAAIVVTGVGEIRLFPNR